MKILLVIWSLFLTACTSSEPVTPEQALSKIPKDLRVFDGYIETMNKADKTANDVQNMAEAQRRIIDQAEAQAGK